MHQFLYAYTQKDLVETPGKYTKRCNCVPQAPQTLSPADRNPEETGKHADILVCEEDKMLKQHITSWS